MGSMHNAPFEFARREVNALLPFLNVGGRILMLAYPRERYEQLGAKSFAEFGQMTDGERTPWCEWYDPAKALELVGPGFRLEYTTIFGASPNEFNWFELVRERS